jgi:hypothetical protein
LFLIILPIFVENNVMKNILLSIIALAFLSACNPAPQIKLHAVENVKGAVYGDSIKNANIIHVASLTTLMRGETKKDIKIRGRVEEVCKKKGCWMTMKLENGEKMRITFKDYKFFVPGDIEGKEVIIDGFVYVNTTPVDQLQHFAKDGGKTDAEIALITKPKTELAYQAAGVAVVN